MLIVITSSLLQSCVKDYFDTNKIAEIKYNPNFAIPLVYSTLSIDDIINLKEASGVKSFLQTESDNSITLIYQNSVLSQDASALAGLTLPSPSQSLAAPIVVPPGAGTINQTLTMPFATAVVPTKIDSIGFKNGTIDFSFFVLSDSGQIDINIPGAKKNGVAFSQTVTLPSAGASYNLTGYTFDMTKVSGGPAYNQFDINFTITTYGGSPGGSLQITSSMNGLQFSKIFGDLGTQSISTNGDTIPISIFKRSKGAGTFSLYAPKVKLITYNSFGLPMNVQLTQLTGINSTGSSFPIVTPPFPLNIATPALNQVGRSLLDSTILTTANSQIRTVFSNTPNQVVYAVDVQSNPGVTQSNFVLDTSKFKMDVEVEIPLWGYASNFSIVDTIPFKMGKISDYAESGLVRLYNSNGFPLDVGLQVYFADSLYHVLDSLINPNQLLLNSGVVNTTTGRVTSPTETTLDATINSPRLQKLNTCKYIIIQGSLGTTNANTTPPPNVKIYSDYALTVQIGIQVQVNIKANPNKK